MAAKLAAFTVMWFVILLFSVVLCNGQQQIDENATCYATENDIRSFREVVNDASDIFLYNILNFNRGLLDGYSAENIVAPNFLRLIGNLSVLVRPFTGDVFRRTNPATNCVRNAEKQLVNFLEETLNYRNSLLRKIYDIDARLKEIPGGDGLWRIISENSIEQGLLKIVRALYKANTDRVAAVRHHCAHHGPEIWLEKLHMLPFLLKHFQISRKPVASLLSDDQMNVYLEAVTNKMQLAAILLSACMGIERGFASSESQDLEYAERLLVHSLTNLIGNQIISYKLTRYLNETSQRELIDNRPLSVVTDTLQRALTENITWLEFRVYGIETATGRHSYEWENSCSPNYDTGMRASGWVFDSCDITETRAFYVQYELRSDVAAMATYRQRSYYESSNQYFITWNLISRVTDDDYKSLKNRFVEAYRNFRFNCSDVAAEGINATDVMQPMWDMKFYRPPYKFLYYGQKSKLTHANGRIFEVNICNDHVLTYGF